MISILLPLLFDTAGLCLRNYSICLCNHWDHSGHNNFLWVSSLNDEIFPFEIFPFSLQKLTFVFVIAETTEVPVNPSEVPGK